MVHRFDLGEIGGTALCALLSLAAFVPLVVYAGRLPAALALAISLACPLVWLIVWLWSGGRGVGLAQRLKRRGEGRRPSRGWANQPARAPTEA